MILILICTTYYFESKQVSNFLRVTLPPPVLYNRLLAIIEIGRQVSRPKMRAHILVKNLKLKAFIAKGLLGGKTRESKIRKFKDFKYSSYTQEASSYKFNRHRNAVDFI